MRRRSRSIKHSLVCLALAVLPLGAAMDLDSRLARFRYQISDGFNVVFCNLARVLTASLRQILSLALRSAAVSLSSQIFLWHSSSLDIQAKTGLTVQLIIVA